MHLLGGRALVVEDDRSWQDILTEILADAGLAVDVARSLEEATASLRAHPHRLAMVDLSLAGSDHRNRDGLRVLEAVRRLDPGCVTMLLSGFATVELAVSALTEYGAFTCLRKEVFNRAEFRDLVSQALAHIPHLDTDANDSGRTLSASLTPRGTGADDRSEALSSGNKQSPAKRTLIVEDDAGWGSVLSELLTDAGYQARLCASFGEALGYLRREKYTLAVVDLSLAASGLRGANLWNFPSRQNLDGRRLLLSIRAAGIPSIVVSGTASPAGIERLYSEHGIFAYLEKQTFDRRVFLRTVDEAQSASKPGTDLDSLTERERQVLELLARGMTNKEIADALTITTNTVKRHLKAIFQKLEIHTRAAAAAKAISAGFPDE